MSKSLGDLLREMDAKATKGPWLSYVRRSADRGAFEAQVHLGAPLISHSVAEVFGANDGAVMASLRNALPLLAAVLDAADAMRDWTPVSYVPGLPPEPIEALRVEACATYDAARAALAEALKEGR